MNNELNYSLEKFGDALHQLKIGVAGVTNDLARDDDGNIAHHHEIRMYRFFTKYKWKSGVKSQNNN